MATFTSLPTDIVRIILYYIVNRVGKFINSDKVVIPLLAVCRKWRSIAAPLFYTHAYHWNCSTDVSSSPYYFFVWTNTILILKNEYASSVRQFSFSSQNNIHAADSLLHIARTLNINSENCPDINSLMDLCGRNEDILTNWWNPRRITAITAIATKFASTFPNIKRLDIDIKDVHGIVMCFLLKLVDCFADRLIEFKYKGPQYFPNTRPLTCLQKVHLHFVGNGEELMHLSISPQSIQKLTIFTNDSAFDWVIFDRSCTSNDIVFVQLEHLVCTSDDGYRPNGGSHVDHRLHFPKIKKALVQNSVLSDDDIENQIQTGLQELVYSVDLSKIMELSRLDLSRLRYLKLKFFGPDNKDKEDEFVARTNTLFSRLKGIPIIQCNIAFRIHPVCLKGTHWRNLKWLVLDVDAMCGNIFDAVLNMPDLIYLEIYNCSFDETMLELLIKYFKTLRTSNTEPSGSNIATLKISGIEQICYEPLKSAVQILKWYWPKLTTIDVRIIPSLSCL